MKRPGESRKRTSRAPYCAGCANGVLDGDNGMGQVAAAPAMEWVLEMTRQEGVGMVSVRRSNHFGAAGYYACLAAAIGCIGAAMTSGYPNTEPWGGKKRMLGIHPLAVATPAAEEPAVVLDVATSVVAQGKLALAAKKGEPVPFGWALDGDGRPTQDSQIAEHDLLVPQG